MSVHLHNWIQKAESTGGQDPSYITVNEIVIPVNDRSYWLDAADTLDTNRLLYMGLYPTRNQVLIEVASRRGDQHTF